MKATLLSNLQGLELFAICTGYVCRNRITRQIALGMGLATSQATSSGPPASVQTLSHRYVLAWY